MSERLAPTGELIRQEMRLSELARHWLAMLVEEGRIEQSTINEYQRVVTSSILPSLGGLRIRETTTGRLDRFLLKLKQDSPNRQRKAKVVLGAMLDVAVRHDVIAVIPFVALADFTERSGKPGSFAPRTSSPSGRPSGPGWYEKDPVLSRQGIWPTSWT